MLMCVQPMAFCGARYWIRATHTRTHTRARAHTHTHAHTHTRTRAVYRVVIAMGEVEATLDRILEDLEGGRDPLENVDRIGVGRLVRVVPERCLEVVPPQR